MNDLQKLIARIDSIGASIASQWILLTGVVVDCITHYHKNDYETSALAHLQDMVSYGNKSMADAYAEVIKQTTGVTFSRDYDNLEKPDEASHSSNSLKKAIEKFGDWEATLKAVTDSGVKDYAPSKAKDAVKRSERKTSSTKAGKVKDVTQETIDRAAKSDELQTQTDELTAETNELKAEVIELKVAQEAALIINENHPLYAQLKELIGLADELEVSQAREMIQASTGKLAHALASNTGDSLVSVLNRIHDSAKRIFYAKA